MTSWLFRFNRYLYYTMVLILRQDFGICKYEPVKDRKALAAYVELKGYKIGGEVIFALHDRYALFY